MLNVYGMKMIPGAVSLLAIKNPHKKQTRSTREAHTHKRKKKKD